MLPRRRFLSQSCVLSALGLPSACATPNSASGPGPVSVSFDAAIPGPVIDPHFLGLSYEKDRIWRRLFDVADTGLVGLFHALGQGVLRIGGNSVDKTVWRADGPGRQAGFVARPDIDRLAGFVRATGWQIIYAVNMGGSSPAAAADEAADAARAFGPALLGLEIGNEPDVYRHNGLRPASYSYGPFQREWQDFATAIRARTPDIVLTGPATAGDVAGFTVRFASDHGAEIALLTQHYYRANGRNPSSTIDLLLQPDGRLPGMLASLASASTRNRIALGFRMAKSNSFYNGGAPNISNAYGSALWLLDFLLTLARGGAGGVNLHGGGNGPGYTPIADDGRAPVEVRPEYVAMLMFSRLAGGRMLPTRVATGGLNLAGGAVAMPNGTSRVLLVNKDGQGGTRIELPGWSAGLTRLTGPTLNSPSGVLLGGAPVGPDGHWAGREEPLRAAAGCLTFDLPPASAALVAIR